MSCSLKHSPTLSTSTLGRSTSVSAPRDPQVFPPIDEGELQSHANVFLSILAEYGLCTRTNTEPGSSGEQNTFGKRRQTASGDSLSNVTHQLNGGRETTNKRDVDSCSDNGPNRPGKSRKWTRRCGSLERHWACQYAKHDGMTYQKCVGWSCERIATVAIHLRSKHALIPAIEYETKKQPPVKRPEDRWKAYYRELFGTPLDRPDLVPSPYFEDATISGPTTVTPELDSPLSAD